MPAEEAGIEPGDVLIAVNGEDVRATIVGVAQKLNGPEGSTVGLPVCRGGEKREFSVERAELEVLAAS